MIRPYPHRPDEAWARDQYPRKVAGLAQVTQNLQKGRIRTHTTNAGIDDAFEGAALGWFLGEPAETLRELFTAALPLARWALEHDDAPEWSSTLRRIILTELAGDDDLAVEVARAGAGAPITQTGDEFDATVVALVLGQDTLAGEHAGTLATALQNPATDPITIQYFGGLSDVAGCVISLDQAGFEASLHARQAITTARARRTVETRRRWSGLLDHYSAAVALIGVRRGLRLPDDIPSLPVPLLIGT